MVTGSGSREGGIFPSDVAHSCGQWLRNECVTCGSVVDQSTTDEIGSV